MGLIPLVYDGHRSPLIYCQCYLLLVEKILGALVYFISAIPLLILDSPPTSFLEVVEVELELCD